MVSIRPLPTPSTLCLPIVTKVCIAGVKSMVSRLRRSLIKPKEPNFFGPYIWPMKIIVFKVTKERKRKRKLTHSYTHSYTRTHAENESSQRPTTTRHTHHNNQSITIAITISRQQTPQIQLTVNRWMEHSRNRNLFLNNTQSWRERERES